MSPSDYGPDPKKTREERLQQLTELSETNRGFAIVKSLMHAASGVPEGTEPLGWRGLTRDKFVLAILSVEYPDAA
jgi:hypothetical protein